LVELAAFGGGDGAGLLSWPMRIVGLPESAPFRREPSGLVVG
jgi:hypothetical protein